MTHPNTPRFVIARGHALRRLFAVALVSVGLSLASSHAATLYWNPPSGGAGNWNSTDTAWSTNAAGPSNAIWSSSSTATDIARFAFSGGTVTQQGTLGAGGLQFDVTGYTINGSSSGTQLVLNDDRTITVATGATATLGANTRIMGGDAAEVGFAKEGAGTLVIQGTSLYIGDGFGFGNRRTFEVNEGTLRVESNAFNNTRHTIDVAAGATLDMHNTVNIGRVLGAGTITNSSATARNLRTRDTSNFTGVISGNINLAGSSIAATINSPTFTIGGSDANTFTGNVTVSRIKYVLDKPEGVDAISGANIRFSNSNLVNSNAANAPRITLMANEQINDSTDMRFQGQQTGGSWHDMILDLNGYSERLGVLEIGALSVHPGTIDFGDNVLAQYLWFSEFVVGAAGVPAINILNFQLGQDELRFDLNPTANLAWLDFDGIGATAFYDSVNDYWVVTPIPEPRAALLVLAAAVLLLYRRRRRA